jgi:hypothetical protein
MPGAWFNDAQAAYGCQKGIGDSIVQKPDRIMTILKRKCRNAAHTQRNGKKSPKD